MLNLTTSAHSSSMKVVGPLLAIEHRSFLQWKLRTKSATMFATSASNCSSQSQAPNGSESHRGRFFLFARRSKERLFLKAEHSRDDHGGEYLNLRIKPGDAVVVKLPRVSDAIFRAGQFFLQCNKILVGLQFRIRFGYVQQTC